MNVITPPCDHGVSSPRGGHPFENLENIDHILVGHAGHLVLCPSAHDLAFAVIEEPQVLSTVRSPALTAENLVWILSKPVQDLCTGLPGDLHASSIRVFADFSARLLAVTDAVTGFDVGGVDTINVGLYR